MQNLSDILTLFYTPTWPSHHVSENQNIFKFLSNETRATFEVDQNYPLPDGSSPLELLNTICIPRSVAYLQVFNSFYAVMTQT